LFSQENIYFDDFSTDDYEYGIMYVEMRIYENNIELVNKYKKLINIIPVIKKYSNDDNTIYAFTGYIIDNENNVSVIDVKLKLLNTDFAVIENKLVQEFNITDNEFSKLVENMNKPEDYVIKGKDENGSFIMHKKLFVNDSFEIEDTFGMSYAYILFLNYSNIEHENLSRRLLYYIMDFTY
jgi:hypothetical protein